MSRLSFVLAAVIGPLAVSAGATAQELLVPSVLPSLESRPVYSGPALRLQSAIDEALKANPRLVALRVSAEAVGQRPPQAMSLPPPVLSAEVWQWPINTVDPRNTGMYMLSIEQDIPGRGKRDLRAALARADANSATADIAVATRVVVTALKRSYARLEAARMKADLYTDIARLLRQTAEVAESLYAAGRIPQADALKPATELSKLYDAALAAQQDADLMSAELNTLMGRNPAEPIGVLDDFPPPELTADAATLRSRAAQQQPELRVAQVAVDHAGADLAVARSDSKADYTVQGGYMLTPRGTDAWMGQIGITWPSAPWSRDRVSARVSEATKALDATRARLNAVEATVSLSVEQAVVRVRTAQQRRALLQSTVIPQITHTLEASRVAYENDRGDLLSLLDNERVLLAERLDLITVTGDLYDAITDLERASGLELWPVPPTTGGEGR